MGISRYYSNHTARVCVTCRQLKPWDEFYKHPTGSNGHQAQCKDCFRIKYDGADKPRAKVTPKGRECSKCGEYKLWDQFYHRTREGKKCTETACKACTLANTRRNKLLRVYGLTIETYAAMLEEQNHVCAICHQPETAKAPAGHTIPLAVDHDHTSGNVRALLCRRCNTSIGKFNDDPKLLQSALDYLTYRSNSN